MPAAASAEYYPPMASGFGVDFCSDCAFERTPRMLIRKRANNVQVRAKRHPNGGDEENRTPDPLLARQVLSQLSYTPKFSSTLR